MTPARFRELALALPGAAEGAHHDHPDFRAHGRIFASLHPDGRRGMVRVPPARQQELVRQDGATWEPAAGAWGRAGCTMVVLQRVDAATLRAALTDAWEFALAQGAAKRPRRAPAATANTTAAKTKAAKSPRQRKPAAGRRGEGPTRR